jgi:cell division protein FtsW (lipid II flippase)
MIMDTLLTPGLIGSVIGILGGLVGTYFSIHNTKTPAERRFMVCAAIWTWLGVFAFLAVLFLIPVPWRWLAWLPYVIILPLAIRYMNRRQNAIRESDRNA